MTKHFYILLLIVFCGCSEQNMPTMKIPKFKDGIYCAKIEYLDEKERKIYEYNLNVQVIKDKVAVIFDSNEDTLITVVSHSGFLDQFGFATVTNKDERYALNITGERCNEHIFGISSLND